MPTIAIFFGIAVRMFFLDTKQHNLPHIHVEYQSRKAVILIPSGELIEGDLPPKKLALVRRWIALRQAELMDNWQHAVNGEPVAQIPPLE